MPKIICASLLFVAVFFSLSTNSLGQDKTSQVQKQQERYTVSLDLEFTRKNGNSLDGTLSVLFGADPNGFATGFLVGNRLVMTAYHVVSGNLSDAKKINLGFKPTDELDVKIYIYGCKAHVLKIDKDADLALLQICGSKKSRSLTFQSTPNKDERLLIIARPNGTKMVSRGILQGSYSLRGQEYWSAKVDSRDGYSGSPVYNHKAEVVGVFTGYDRIQDVALISPAARAQKLIEDYYSDSRPLRQ
jgi:S1-C subfamily serine protease